MVYHLGVEDIEPKHWVAFVFDHPGCFSSATTQAQAIANAPARIAEYFDWLASYDCAMPSRSASIEVQVAEAFHSFTSASDPDYVVNAFFEDDWQQLTRDEVESALALLGYSRRDLLTLIEKFSPAQLAEPIPGDAKNPIVKILDHIAWAEWWYFDRLSLAFPRVEMRGEIFAKLDKVRAQTRAQLPRLIGDNRIVEKVGEQWSPRKVLRRTLWHERDHMEQIKKLTWN